MGRSRATALLVTDGCPVCCPGRDKRDRRDTRDGRALCLGGYLIDNASKSTRREVGALRETCPGYCPGRGLPVSHVGQRNGAPSRELVGQTLLCQNSVGDGGRSRPKPSSCALLFTPRIRNDEPGESDIIRVAVSGGSLVSHLSHHNTGVGDRLKRAAAHPLPAFLKEFQWHQGYAAGQSNGISGVSSIKGVLVAS
jgi:hypothetical protein